MNDFRPTPQDWYDRATITRAVQSEQYRQDRKWGQQNHDNGTGPETMPLRHIAGSWNSAADLARAATAETDRRAAIGAVTWRDILLEEVFEAIAEDDPGRLETELIQVSAVAQQWAAAIKRRRRRDAEPVVIPTEGEHQ